MPILEIGLHWFALILYFITAFIFEGLSVGLTRGGNNEITTKLKQIKMLIFLK